MSKKVDVIIRCPKCGHEFSMSLFRSIWGEYPENRELVMTDKINVSVCPKCEDKLKLPFSLFYTNSKQQFAVWWEPVKDPNVDNDVAGYTQMMGKDSYLAAAPRISDWEEFKNTIIKFEKGELKGGTVPNVNMFSEDFLKSLKKSTKDSKPGFFKRLFGGL